MGKNTAPLLEFAETAAGFTHCINMETTGFIHLASKGNSDFFVNCDGFTQIVVAKPTPFDVAETAADLLLKPWII